VQVREISVALVQVEAVADVELVRDGEADVPDGQVADEAAVRAVEERGDRDRAGRAQPERPAEVVERQPGVDDVFHDQEVPAADVGVEVLEQADAALAAPVRLELEEVERERDPDAAGQVGREDQAAAEGHDEERVLPVVVLRDLRPQLADAAGDLVGAEVDLAEAHVAISSPQRAASRSRSRL
jgi:hypothetical protein